MPDGFVSMSSWVKRGGRIGRRMASELAAVEWVAIRFVCEPVPHKGPVPKKQKDRAPGLAGDRE